MRNPHPANLGDLLLASGAVEGPARRVRPFRLSLFARLMRAVRARVLPKGPAL